MSRSEESGHTQSSVTTRQIGKDIKIQVRDKQGTATCWQHGTNSGDKKSRLGLVTQISSQNQQTKGIQTRVRQSWVSNRIKQAFRNTSQKGKAEDHPAKILGRLLV